MDFRPVAHLRPDLGVPCQIIQRLQQVVRREPRDEDPCGPILNGLPNSPGIRGDNGKTCSLSLYQGEPESLSAFARGEHIECGPAVPFTHPIVWHFTYEMNLAK